METSSTRPITHRLDAPPGQPAAGGPDDRAPGDRRLNAAPLVTASPADPAVDELR